MQAYFVDALRRRAEADSRVLAAWLAGSLGRGTADRYSDVDAYLLIGEKDIEGFRNGVESWLSAIRPLVLFRTLFEGQMINCLTVDGLRVDLWLRGGEAVSMNDPHIQVLFDGGGHVERQRAVLGPLPSRSLPHPVDFRRLQGPEPEIQAALQRHIGEFWRCISILPTVLGRDERVTGFMGLWAELNPLTEMLIVGNGRVRDAGVKNLNRFLSPAQREEIERALAMQGLSADGLARTHLRLAQIMRRHGPAIAQEHGIPYPADLEKAVLDYISGELRLLGFEACLEELEA